MRTYLNLIFIAFIVLCAFFSAVSDVFLTLPNILNILTASTVIGILAIGATFVIGAGGIDLSVGSLLALSAVAGVISTTDPYSSVTLTILICIGIGLGTGAINGYFIGKLKVPAFIATLGMMSFARGMALILSDGRPIYGLPEALVSIGQGRIFNVPVPIIIFTVVVFLGHIILNHTKFGRHCLTIGDNEAACRNAGIQVFRHKIFLYAFSGGLAAIAGIISMSRVNAADPAAGMMYELTAITAAIIGGTSLSGGKASVGGTVLGTLIMGVLQNGMTLMNTPAYYQQVAIGIVLIAAVSFGQWRGVHAVAR